MLPRLEPLLRRCGPPLMRASAALVPLLVAGAARAEDAPPPTARHRRHRLGARGVRARADDDAAGPRALLRRPGAREERAQRPHAVLRRRRRRRRALDPGRLQPRLRHRRAPSSATSRRWASPASRSSSVTANFASPPRNIPEYIFVMFQAMFAIITPALILGAVAERMKFSGLRRLHLDLAAASSTARSRTWCGGGGLDLQGGRDRLRRRPRRAHVERLLGARRGAHARQAPRLRQGADAAAQPAALPDRRRPALDGLVRLQRRQRAQREPARGARRSSTPAPRPRRRS